MEIRRADEHDLAAIIALYGEASDLMTGTPFDCRWRRGGHPTDEFVTSLVRDGATFVAIENGELAGVVAVNHDLGHDYGPLPWLVDAPDEEVAAIHLLAVRAGYRGQGLSRKLLHACLDGAREQGMRTARLDATANNLPAIALYESEGFAHIHSATIEAGTPDEPLVPFVVMELPL